VLRVRCGDICSQVSDYLLEKSRVARQADRERNFHVFYQFLGARGGGDPATTRLHSLLSSSPDQYRYLCNGVVLPPDSVEDVAAYEDEIDYDPDLACAPPSTQSPQPQSPNGREGSERMDKAR
jgi:hypothetical protein